MQSGFSARATCGLGLALCALALLLDPGAARPGGAQVTSAQPAFDPIVFERSKAEGAVFTTNSSRTPHKHQPETMVSGVALFDYNNDGLLDIYVVNGATMPGLDKTKPDFFNRLFENEGNGRFRDVTLRAGVAGKGYDQGAAVGDYDNDGWQDLFVAGLRGNVLYHNNGDGTFTDVTAKAGLARGDPDYGTLWSVAAAFADIDNDGRLDLFVSNYCVWDPTTEPVCGDKFAPDYCHPKHYKGLPNSLFRNNGDGTFSDISQSSGIRKHIGKGMGIGVADFDGDGYVDFFVANDTLPSSVFMNKRDLTFREVGLQLNAAYTAQGAVISGMGVDARDIDDDGWPDVFETALMGETMPLFRNMGGKYFEDVTAAAGVANYTRMRSGWSNGIVDLNNDGAKDLFVACADVMDPAGPLRERVAMASAVFVNLGSGRFADGSATAGAEFSTRKAVHRGAAFGDLDNDGRVDVVTTALDGPLVVWRNVSPAPNHWLSILTIGSKSNRDGVGAKITVVTASGTQHNHVNTAVGYGCASDRRVHFGLGKEKVARELHVLWPSGANQTLRDVAADQVLIVREP
jgi:enediyne biosynthesis protein E4